MSERETDTPTEGAIEGKPRTSDSPLDTPTKDELQRRLDAERVQRALEHSDKLHAADVKPEPAPAADPRAEHDEEPPFDPHSVRCDTCRGWGIVQTGSLVENQQTRQCPDCRGIGWIDRLALVPPASAPIEPQSLDAWYDEPDVRPYTPRVVS